MIRGKLAAAATVIMLATPGAALAQHHHGGGGWGGGWHHGGGGWHHGWVGPAIGLGVAGALAAPYAYRYYEPAEPAYQPAPSRCWYPDFQAYYACE